MSPEYIAHIKAFNRRIEGKRPRNIRVSDEMLALIAVERERLKRQHGVNATGARIIEGLLRTYCVDAIADEG